MLHILKVLLTFSTIAFFLIDCIQIGIIEYKKKIIEILKERPGIQEIFEDRTINIPDIPENLKKLKPDIVAWSNNRSSCIMIEISVPYGKKNWEAYTFAEAYKHKKEKYADIVNFLRDRKIDATFYVIIVSSIGAIFKESNKNINCIVTSKKKAKATIRRISVNAIIGSMNIWHRISSPNKDGFQLVPDVMPEMEAASDISEVDLLSDS